MESDIIEIENQIRKLLAHQCSECDMLDYKIDPYDLSSDKGRADFAHDVVAFLNCHKRIGQDKYIIFGVADDTRYQRGIKGNMPDDNVFQSLAQSLIRPAPYILTGDVTYDDKQFGYIFISRNNSEYPYEIAKTIYFESRNQNRVISEGQAFMRIGSLTRIMAEADRRVLVNTVTSPYIGLSADRSHMNMAASGLSMLLTMALIGSWNDAYQGDQEVISSFVGESYDIWIQKVHSELNGGNTDIVHFQNSWKVKNRAEIIHSHSHTMFDSHMDRIRAAAVLVLGTADPKYSLPSNERYVASIRGVEKKYSSAISSGLAETLAIIKHHKDSFINTTHNKTEVICIRAVRDIFSQCTWKTFQTLGWSLSFLAQAAPGEFLSVIEKHSTEIHTLFHESEDGIVKANYGYELLHALKMLAWFKDHAGRACLCLAQIGVYDIRAVSALSDVLLPWHPQTMASQDIRTAIVRESVKLLEGQSWILMKHLLPGGSNTVQKTDKPHYLLPNEDDEEITTHDFWLASKQYLKIALQLRPMNKELFFSIIDSYHMVTEDMRKMICASFVELALTDDICDEERFLFWDKLYEYTDWHEGHQSEKSFLSTEDIESLRNLALCFEPKSIIIKASRLFQDSHWKLLETWKYDYKEAEAILRHRQCEAIEEVWAEGKLPAIISLVQISAQTGLIGYCLATLNSIPCQSDEYAITEMYQVDESPESNFAAGYINSKFDHHGFEWISTHQLVKWEPQRQAVLYSRLPVNIENWAWVENQLGDDAILYWKNVNIRALEVIPGEVYIIEMLIKAGRIIEGLIYCHRSLEKIDNFVSSEVVLNLFDLMSTVQEGLDQQYIQYCICELVEWLQENNADFIRLALLEWRFFNIFEHDVTAKTLYQYISADPHFFIALLKILYRRHDGKIEDEEVQELGESVDNETLVRHAWNVLYKWNITPGVQKDGSFDTTAMHGWINTVKRLSKECDRYEIAMEHLGQVAFYAPPDPSGFFMNESVAAMLNSKDADLLRNGYRMRVFNNRGAYFVDPTGEAEFAIERMWKDRADEADKRGLFLLGNTLRQIAEEYYREGKQHIADNSQEREWDDGR